MPRCVQTLHAFKRRGLPLRHQGHSQSQGSSSSASWHRGSFLSKRRMSASRVKGNGKNCSLSARMSCFDRVCLTSHVLQQEQEELRASSALLRVVEASGGNADSDDVEGAHHLHFCSSIFGEKLLAHTWRHPHCEPGTQKNQVSSARDEQQLLGGLPLTAPLIRHSMFFFNSFSYGGQAKEKFQIWGCSSSILATAVKAAPAPHLRFF